MRARFRSSRIRFAAAFAAAPGGVRRALASFDGCQRPNLTVHLESVI